MTSELSDGGEIATGIAVLPSTNIPNIPPNMNMDLSMSHSQPMGMQHRLQPTQFINWIPSHLPLQMDANFDPNNMHHPNSVMAIPYPVPFQNQFYQSNPYPPNYAYQPFVTQLETRYISIPTVNTLPSIQMPTQNTPNDMHPRSDSQIPPGPSSVNIPLMPNGSNPMFDFQMDSIPYHHEYMQAQLPQDDTDSSVNQKQSKPKRSQTKKAPKLKSPPPKNILKKNPRGKDDESIDKSSPHPQNELNSDLVDDLVIFSAAQSDAVTQPTHLQDQLAKYKVVQAPPSGEPSPAFYKAAAHIRGPKVCCALGCEQVITKRRLCARHQKQKERNGGKISLKPEMEVGPTPIKRKKEDENIGPSSVTSPPDMTASIKIDYSQPPAAEKSNGAKPKKAPRKGKMSPKKKAKQELDSSETGHMSHENGMENGRYTAMNNNNYMNNASLYDTNRTMLTQSGSLEDMFQSQEGTDVSEPQSDASNDQLCDNYFKEIL